MLNLVWGFAIITTCVLLIPILVFCVEIFAAVCVNTNLRSQAAISGKSHSTAWRRPTVAVVIPAHDEEAGIAATVASAKAQLKDGDKLLVVADNCSDKTAVVASEAGAEVVERSDKVRRGKGYALDYGIQYLKQKKSLDMVIILDADCLLGEGAIHALVAKSVETGLPSQALYLMQGSKEGGGITEKIRLFAWEVKNYMRALGMRRLGFPCPLMGTGMVFQVKHLERISLANGCIVEDLKLGLDLIAAGSPPVFCDTALVTSQFPTDTDAASGQRKRWEHGHLAIILEQLPSLLKRAVSEKNTRLLLAALDLSVPPLALLSLFALLLGIVLLVASLFSKVFLLPLGVFTAGLVIFIFAVMIAWHKCGRKYLSVGELASLPIYILAKVPLYVGFIFRRQTKWVRTKRD